MSASCSTCPGKGPLRNEFLVVKAGKMGVEYAVGHCLGNAIDAPVMILKCCIGNRSLGWDLLPPGSERFEVEVTEHKRPEGHQGVCRLQGLAGFLGQGHGEPQDSHRLVCRQTVR